MFTFMGVCMFGTVIWISILLGKFINQLRRSISDDILTKTAYVAVRWVDDKHKKATGSEKFKLACENVVKILPSVKNDSVEVIVSAMYKNYSLEMLK